MEFNINMPLKRPLSPDKKESHILREKRQKNDSDSELEIQKDPEKRAGTVKRMVLKNFMCHSLLEVELKSNINYIIGRNGSGKSAILSALVVGLGAKASTTNRGTSIKGFIKAGKNSASVEIVLINTGDMAYKPAVYGNEITILRSFTSSGSSSYKVKSATGAVISTSPKEIRCITENLNIQVDNPICILNQDTSRNFLSSSDPKQKFTLFMRATKLDTLLKEYKKSVANKIESMKLYKEKEKVYAELKSELNELKKKKDSHKTIITLKDNLITLELELLWSKVKDSEDELHAQEHVVSKLQQTYDQMEDNCKNRVQKFEEIKQRVSELQQQIVELKDAAEVQNRPQLDIQQTMDELKETYNEKLRKKQLIQRDITSKTNDCEALQQEIEKFTSNLSRIEEEKLTRLKESTTLHDKVKRIGSVLETTENDQFQYKTNIGRKEDEERDLQRELAQINNEYSVVRENLRILQGESSNSILLYGSDMPKILEAINGSQHKFTKMPKGPLGQYINIKEKKWAVAVEGFFGPGLLTSFAVDNKNDNVILMEIFDKHCRQGPKPMIITSKFFSQVHDVSNNLVQSIDGCVSIYDAIDVSDPVVMNCLIDQMLIESVLLMPSTEKAIELMSDKARVPANCSQGITIKGDVYYPDPDYKSYGSNYHQARFLQVNTVDLISQYKEKLQSLSHKRQTVQNQYNAVQSDKHEQQNKLKELQIKVDKLKQSNYAFKRKLDELKSSVEPESVNVHSLETELTNLKNIIKQRKVDAEKIMQEIREIKEAISENQDKLNKLKDLSRNFEDRIIPLEQQIMEQSSKKNELNISDTCEKKRIQELKNRLELQRSNMLEKQKVVDEQMQQAHTVGEKLDDVRKVPEIVADINDAQKTIRKIESSVENPEEIKRKYVVIKRKYYEGAEIMHSLLASIQELEKAVENRNRHYECTEDYFITSLSYYFRKIMRFRQFKGNLKVDMKKQELDLVVLPQQGSQGHTATANLSGGERSFSTVAFLYALWQCMEFPFYFLDEFDVFMDAVNRTKVMDTLICHAKSKPELQFVFLTPQDVSFIHDESVAIHRLEDPERNVVQ